MLEKLQEIENREKNLRQQLKDARNQNLALDEVPMVVGEINRELLFLNHKKQKTMQEISNSGVSKTLGTATVLISVNGDEDKEMKVVIAEENIPEIIVGINNTFVVSKECPLFNAIKTAKEDDLVIMTKELKGKKITTFIRVVEKSF